MKISKTRRAAVAVVAAAILAVGCLGLAGCGSSSNSSSASSSDDTTITVACVPTPHAEILNNVVAPLLAEQGYTLKVTEFNDYVQPNTAVEQGEFDANYFQHQPYLDSFNEEQGTHLVSVCAVHYEPFGIYAGRSTSIDQVKTKLANGESVEIAVPNDTTNEARALLLLQQEGIITLSANAGITATPKDIVDMPSNLTIRELEAAQCAQSKDDVDIACINSNYAIEAGLNPSVDALAIEDASGTAAQTYANVLVVKSGNEDLPKIQALATALTSAEVRNYINETYNGAVLPIF